MPVTDPRSFTDGISFPTRRTAKYREGFRFTDDFFPLIDTLLHSWHHIYNIDPVTKTYAMNSEGIVIHPSQLTVKETIDRLVVYLQQHGTTVYARINQQTELNNVGLKIHPLEFILVGNPKAGGLAFPENPVSGLAFPLKAIS